MTAPLDQARLREAIERLGVDADRYFPEDPTPMQQDLFVVLKAYRSVSDALSAERERGDRAVGLVERLADWIGAIEEAEPFEVIVEDARAFLATQKAEGGVT